VNCFLPDSVALLISSSVPSSPLAKSQAAPMLRAARNNPAITSSLTALALAPGALNTGMPRSLMASTGILFTPAPARPMASTESAMGLSCIFSERSSRASGCSISGEVS